MEQEAYETKVFPNKTLLIPSGMSRCLQKRLSDRKATMTRAFLIGCR